MQPNSNKHYIVSKKFFYWFVAITGAITVNVIAMTLRHPKEQEATASTTNCTQLKADGHRDIKKNDKLYSSKLDRDHDGIACET